MAAELNGLLGNRETEAKPTTKSGYAFVTAFLQRGLSHVRRVSRIFATQRAFAALRTLASSKPLLLCFDCRRTDGSVVSWGSPRCGWAPGRLPFCPEKQKHRGIFGIDVPQFLKTRGLLLGSFHCQSYSGVCVPECFLSFWPACTRWKQIRRCPA